MRQKPTTFVEQVVILTALGIPINFCAEQWSRPLSERRSDDWIPIAKQPHVSQVEHARDLKPAASDIDQIGSLLTPPVAPSLPPQQSRVLRNPSPQLTSNGFLNPQFKAPPQPPQTPNQPFFSFPTTQPFSLRQQQPPAPPQQTSFKNQAVNNQFNSFFPEPNQFIPPQQILLPQSHFPTPSFFHNQAFADQNNPSSAPVPGRTQPQGPKNEAGRSSKIRFPESQAPGNVGPNPAQNSEDAREEIQLLYVPVETLQQRGRPNNKFKDAPAPPPPPPPSQPNFFPQQIVPQFQTFSQFPQFNQPEFPPIPQFVEDLSQNVKHRFNKPQEKPPTDKPQTVFQNEFIPSQNLQQTFPQDFQKPGTQFQDFLSPPKQQKIPQEPQKVQQDFQQDFALPQKQQFQQEFSKPTKEKPSLVDFASFQQDFQLPDKTQQNFQFEFQQQNIHPQQHDIPQQQIFSQQPSAFSQQNFPSPPTQNFINSSPNFQEQKFAPPRQNLPEQSSTFQTPQTTTQRNIQTNFPHSEISQTLNEVSPTKSVFTEPTSSQKPASLPIQDSSISQEQPLVGMTLAQFGSNDQFFQLPQQTPDFSRPSFETVPQIQHNTPQFTPKQPSEQETFRPSQQIPQTEQLQNQNFQNGRVTHIPSTLPPPHQPPLSVYMENVHNSKVGDVLSLLKNSKTIPVLDNFGKDAPQIFVGPSNLEPPPGYVKFELPYLSSLDTNRIERKVDKLPFFVAPLNFQPPSGYSKIPFPAPHIGSVVVSNATILRAALHEKPSETQGIFEQTTPSIYSLPAEINTINPHLPSQVNSLQTTPRFTTGAETPVTESVPPRRNRYRTTTSAPGNNYLQRRPTTTNTNRQRKPLHRGFPKSGVTISSTTTTTEAPLEITTIPAFVPEISQSKTHFGSDKEYIEQTVIPVQQQSSQPHQVSNDQNPQQSFDSQYFQRQQPIQNVESQSSGQQSFEQLPYSSESSEPQQGSRQEQQGFNQGSEFYSQEQLTYNQDSQTQVQDQQYNFQEQQNRGQSDIKSDEHTTSPSVEISSSNYQNILSPSQYHSEISNNGQHYKTESVKDQASNAQSVSGVESVYQQNEPVNTANENQYVSHNQVEQNNLGQTDGKYESQPQETTVASYLEINEPETEKPEKLIKHKSKYYHKTNEHTRVHEKDYSVPDQSNILQTHQRVNTFLAQEQSKEQENAAPTGSESTEETTTKKLGRGRVRGRQRYTSRTSTTEKPEEQNYPKNFNTHGYQSTEHENYPVYNRQTESSSSESSTSAETQVTKSEKFNSFKRRRPLRPSSTTTVQTPMEEATTTPTPVRSTRVRVTKQPSATSRLSSGRTRARRPGVTTAASTTTSSTTEIAATDNLDWGTYVNSFAPSAGSNEVASPYDDKSITFHNIESHRRNPNYNKVTKTDGYWANDGVTIHQSEGVELKSETYTPTESSINSGKSYTHPDTESSSTTQHSRILDRKALYRQRLRYGDGEISQKKSNAPKDRYTTSKKLSTSREDQTYYDGNTLQQNEDKANQRSEEYQGQQDYGQKSEEGNTSQETVDQRKTEERPAEQNKSNISAGEKKAGVGRRRGAWVRVRVKKPQDVFETAESQSFAKLSGNVIKNIEKQKLDIVEAKEHNSKTFDAHSVNLSQEQIPLVDESQSPTVLGEQNVENEQENIEESKQGEAIEEQETPEEKEVETMEVEPQQEDQQSPEAINETLKQDQEVEEQEIPETPEVQEAGEVQNAQHVEEQDAGNTSVFQKDIGEMIRDIINGESEIDEIESNVEKRAHETSTEKQEVNDALVGITLPPVRNQTTVFPTTLSELETDATTPSRHSEEQEITTPIPTTIEQETVTKKVLGTSTTTEISLETEICYKGRCVKSKKTKATDLLPAE